MFDLLVALVSCGLQRNPMDSPTLNGFTQFLLRIHDFAVKAESGTRSLVFRLVRYCMTSPSLLPPIVSTVSGAYRVFFFFCRAGLLKRKPCRLDDCFCSRA